MTCMHTSGGRMGLNELDALEFRLAIIPVAAM